MYSDDEKRLLIGDSCAEYDDVDHIYENICKSDLRFSDLFAKYVNKFKPKMINSDKPFARGFTIYCENETDHTDYSYLPSPENIYENVQFNYHDCWADDEIISRNDSLSSWLKALSSDAEAYESTDTMMMTKCIPSRNENVTCSYSMSGRIDSSMTHAANLALDQYKLSVLNKCFAAIWQSDSENDILSGLLFVLNDIMEIAQEKVESSENVQCLESNSNYMPAKRIDKKLNQKLETFILSVTLNRRLITYSESLKFFFALEQSQSRQYFIVKPKRVLNCYHRRCQSLDNVATLKLILSNRTSRTINKSSHLSIDSVKPIVDENIYQPIWDCNGMIRNDENEIFKAFAESDDQDWEIDTEFSFVNPTEGRIHKPNEMYQSVLVFFNTECPELNRIVYLQKATQIDKQISVENRPSDERESQSGIVSSVNECNSVLDWKELLRQPFYSEDEEDMVRDIIRIVWFLNPKTFKIILQLMSTNDLETIHNKYNSASAVQNVTSEEALINKMTSPTSNNLQLVNHDSSFFHLFRRSL